MSRRTDLRQTTAAAIAWFDPHYHSVAISIAAVLAAVISYSVWDLARDAAESEARAQFENRAGRIRDAIQGRMLDYEQVLRGAAGLFAASQDVTRAEWHAYVENLRIEEIYPGIQGIGFALRVPASRKAGHENAVRAEGYAGYSVQPAGERAEYLPIVYIEPFAGRNLRAFGYDMAAEPTRRAAMELARDSGSPAMSGRVRLVQETEEAVQAGFLMYIPVYRAALDTATVAQRRAALVGHVYSPFRMDDLMRGILGRLPDVRLQIVDDGPGEDNPTLFDSSPLGGVIHEPMFRATASLPMRGRTWSLTLTALPAFEQTVDRRTPRLVAVSAGVVSALVLTIIWSLATLRSRAARLARSMTRELSESRERLALAVEGSDQALFDWDVVTGRVVLSERWSRITGRGPEALVTTIRELESLVHPDELEGLRGRLADLIRGRLEFYQAEHRVRTAAGGWRWISSRAKVVERSADGRAQRVAGANVDITERKEIERLKNEFIATVSHELRTPLTAIVGALGLLGQRVTGKLDAESAAFLAMAKQNSERLSALINNVLDLEKIESGRMDFHVGPVAVAPLLERSIALNAPYGERYGVRLELSRPVPEAAVTGDEDRLLQVLTNLLSNAAKFSPAGSTVTVSAAVGDGGRVRIAVADRGPGIPEEFRGRIFQKFEQADGTDARRKGGTGLGLSISRALIEKMGGALGFESTPGQGAVFYFELPGAQLGDA